MIAKCCWFVWGKGRGLLVCLGGAERFVGLFGGSGEVCWFVWGERRGLLVCLVTDNLIVCVSRFFQPNKHIYIYIYIYRYRYNLIVRDSWRGIMKGISHNNR